jgi:DNA-binding MarR family transcriptional regulator
MPAADDRHSREKGAKWREFVSSLNPEIDPDTVQLLDRYLVIFHGLLRVGEKSLAGSGLSFAKYRLLLVLMYSETMEGLSELNPSEISRRQGTSRNTISSLIRDLEDEDLVERHLDQKDKRRFNIRLTDGGRELVRRYAVNHFQAVASCFDGLGFEEREELGKLLTKLGHQTSSAADEVSKP